MREEADRTAKQPGKRIGPKSGAGSSRLEMGMSSGQS
jgi:hypothetical protein